MFASLERPSAAPIAIVVACCLGIAGTALGLAHAAVAGDDLGLRRAEFWPEQVSVAASSPAPATRTAARRRGPRRIWAASRSRPLRVMLARRERRLRLARHRRAGRRTAMAERVARPASPTVLTLPRPDRPALVSIYQDRTLRDGDAVMLADGIHLFHGGARWPHRPDDFLRLQSVVRLGWSLRHTLSDIDSAPPSRWTMAGTRMG
ncbi:hypothetical protein [Lichenibacterium ramalinae]|uniref:Uncharacterized protein n=1 Tax=Lichenibacterium ramalinae TaxID=2316527 RepID=A0A4V1RJ99_9HYPH|nr:hypothetical protein [Lichenibacterium ramalinae]RYB07820.1 hypothetical protein D3272_01455 [Lichenibacterium ramalinae]